MYRSRTLIALESYQTEGRLRDFAGRLGGGIAGAAVGGALGSLVGQPHIGAGIGAGFGASAVRSAQQRKKAKELASRLPKKVSSQQYSSPPSRIQAARSVPRTILVLESLYSEWAPGTTSESRPKMSRAERLKAFRRRVATQPGYQPPRSRSEIKADLRRSIGTAKLQRAAEQF